MSGLHSLTIPEALVSCLATGDQDQPRLTLVEPDGQDQVFTAPQLSALISGAACRAQAAGIQPGEPVLLLFAHGLPVIQSMLGLLQVGAVPCLLPYWSDSSAAYSLGQVRRIAAELGSQWVITSSKLSSTLTGLLAEEPLRLHTLEVPEPALCLDELPRASAPSEEATGYLQLTSGTTDAPKLIAVSHRSLLNHIRALHAHLVIQPTDAFVGWLPLHHDMGLIIQLLLPLLSGTKTVLIAPDYWVLRPRVLFQTVSRYAGTITFMPNFAFNHCTRYVRDMDLTGLDLRSWRRVLNGAEPVRAEDMRAFSELLEPYGVLPTVLGAGYGLGENVGGVTISPPGQLPLVDWVSALALQNNKRAVPVAPTQDDALSVVSCGIPIPGTEIAILDDEHQALSDRGLGEIAVRGDSLCTAYAGANARLIPDDSGWYLTGDIGYLCDGQLYVCDRKKDLIIIGGRNVHPQWIEALAAEVIGPKAGHAAAFAISSRQLGTELPVLICEVRGRFDEAQKAAWVAETRRRAQSELRVALADVRLVRRGWVVQTTSGKVARSATREKYLAAGYRPEPAGLALLRVAGNDLVRLEQALMALVAEMLGVDVVRSGDDFFELGGDSLTAMRFILAVEEARGRRVPTDFLHELTMAHLARLIAGEMATESPSWYPATQMPSKQTVKEPRRFTPRYLLHCLTYTGPLWHGHALPYGLGVRMQRQWIRLPIVQQILRRRCEVLRNWLALVGRDDPDGQEQELSMLANTWRSWREACIQRPETFTRQVTLSGADKLKAALATGQPIVLVGTHTAIRGAAIDIAIQRHSNREVWTLGYSPTSNVNAVGKVIRARDILLQGGIVMVTGDGAQGTRGIQVPLFGCPWLFRSGGAELALDTEAILLPVFNTLANTGQVTVEFLDPLTTSAETKQAQVENLTIQYAALLEAHWPSLLSNMKWDKLQQMIEYSAGSTEA